MKTHIQDETYWEVSDGRIWRTSPPWREDFANRDEAEAYARNVGWPLLRELSAGGEVRANYRLRGIRKPKPSLPAHIHCVICEEKADFAESSEAYDWQWLHEFEHQGHCVEAWETDPAQPGEVFELRKRVCQGRLTIVVPIESLDPEIACDEDDEELD